MKKFILFAGLLMVTACSQEAAPVAETEMGKKNVITSVWQLTFPDGKRGITVTLDDGTYYYASDLNQTGTWSEADGTDGKVFCFNPDGEEAEICATIIDEEGDGTYSGTTRDGAKFTSTKIG